GLPVPPIAAEGRAAAACAPWRNRHRSAGKCLPLAILVTQVPDRHCQPFWWSTRAAQAQEMRHKIPIREHLSEINSISMCHYRMGMSPFAEKLTLACACRLAPGVPGSGYGA